MRVLTFSLLFSFFTTLCYAQSSVITFPSSDLQNIALRYTGDTLNWPLIVALAERNIQNNTFTLEEDDLLRLEILGSTSISVSEQKERMKELIENGATIFAREDLIEAVQAVEIYDTSVKEGDIEATISNGVLIEEKLDEVENTLRENRMVEVQAQLEKKTGTVDKRAGLLGGWDDANEGDLFKESDGVRTQENSYANLGFTDGSKIIVDPNTVAVIRKSRIDRLDESSDTEISLVEGGLLAKLSAAATERSNYVLNAGSSQSKLQTQNFYAEADDDETVKLTNYDGIANVSANDVTITIRKNEGTIVREGEAPSAPIQLLPSPELVWSKADSVVYSDQLIYSFQLVENAQYYIVQRSSSANFDVDVEEVQIVNNSALLSYLTLGTTYVRVQAVDNLGLRGPYSEPTRVIRNVDNQAPPAFIDGLNGNILFTLNESVEIMGLTQPDAKILIDNMPVSVQASGRFIKTIQNLKNDQPISVIASDASGNITNRTIRIVKLSEAELFDFALSGASGKEPIRKINPTATLSATAYPGLEVVIINGGNTRRVVTDSQGRWGITMTMQEGELSITFKDTQSGETYLSKSFTVVAN